jgi:hypothetical protein
MKPPGLVDGDGTREASQGFAQLSSEVRIEVPIERHLVQVLDVLEVVERRLRRALRLRRRCLFDKMYKK